ncbi:unnamed protein product, partial [Vitis vinifera]
MKLYCNSPPIVVYGFVSFFLTFCYHSSIIMAKTMRQFNYKEMIRSHGCQLTGGSYWGAIMPLLHQSLISNAIKPDPTILVQSRLKYYCRTKPRREASLVQKLVLGLCHFQVLLIKLEGGVRERKRFH